MSEKVGVLAVGIFDWLEPLSWLIKVELVIEAGQIRAGLLDKGFRDWRKLCSGKRSAGRLFCPSTMSVRDNLHVVGMALSVELECTFHGHAMNSFRMLHELSKHHSTGDVSSLHCIRSPDAIAVCRARMGSPELHRRDHKQSYDRLSTHRSNEH
jgi:hypothetical protein